tara:strand:+ start:341 stop:1024 length:684 start_codon:yes stop_codon:yes gene_type:complete
MYFSLVPDIEYDVKPINFPYTESQFLTAKNFFRRFEINEDMFSYTTTFNKYSVIEGEMPDTVAEKTYGDPFLDWVVLITNNVINPLFDWPRTDLGVRKYCEKSYTDPYATILYYKTRQIKSGQKTKTDLSGNQVDIIALEEGLKVDEKFYNTPFSYYDGSQTLTLPGSEVCDPVNVYQHEIEENEKRREIWLLKLDYLDAFIEEFTTKNQYQLSSDFISERSKKTGV